MKRVMTGLMLWLAATVAGADAGLISIKSPHSVKDTADRLLVVLKERGLNVVARLDQAAGGVEGDPPLRPVEVVIFSDPENGRPLLRCGASIGIDLPHRMLVWQDAMQQVWLSFNDAYYLGRRHGLKKCDEVLAGMDSVLRELAQAAILAAAPPAAPAPAPVVKKKGK